jgi:hypothetical protein
MREAAQIGFVLMLISGAFSDPICPIICGSS